MGGHKPSSLDALRGAGFAKDLERSFEVTRFVWETREALRRPAEAPQGSALKTRENRTERPCLNSVEQPVRDHPVQPRTDGHPSSRQCEELNPYFRNLLPIWKSHLHSKSHLDRLQNETLSDVGAHPNHRQTLGNAIEMPEARTLRKVSF